MNVPKYVSINLKINNFKDNKSTKTFFFAILFSHINLDVQCSTKVNMFTFKNGVWGLSV